MLTTLLSERRGALACVCLTALKDERMIILFNGQQRGCVRHYSSAMSYEGESGEYEGEVGPPG